MAIFCCVLFFFLKKEYFWFKGAKFVSLKSHKNCLNLVEDLSELFLPYIFFYRNWNEESFYGAFLSVTLDTDPPFAPQPTNPPAHPLPIVTPLDKVFWSSKEISQFSMQF